MRLTTGAHAAVRALDTDRMPLSPSGGFPLPPGWETKVLFARPGGASLELLRIPPGAPGAALHYHEFHEWVYLVEGDFTNNESTTPDSYSILQRYRQGTFLSRPAYSLHGGERGRMPWMASQMGALILNMSESDVYAETYCVDPIVRDTPPEARRLKYNPDYESIQHWTTPRIIDTVDRMPWQPVEGSPGLHIKHLADDRAHGFRATLYLLEPNAPRPERFRPRFYREALELNFVLVGDLHIEAFAAPGAPAMAIDLPCRGFLERPPTSIWGLPETGATRSGAIWIEVTYARGHRWTETPTPIEESEYLG